MKSVAVLALALTACEARYGTYFNIDGDANQIKFDHVELFFGTHTDRSTMGTPEGVAIGKVFDRSFTTSDRIDLSLGTETEYWLPVNDENKTLGYVGAVASKQGQIVGVGELIDFKLEADVVNKYDIELQPKPLGIVDRLDVWGGDPGCFAWRRDRGGLSTIGVMSPTDNDCDGLDPSVDCNDLCPIGATQCDPDLAICGVPQACGVGCNAGATCAIEQCLPGELCTKPCADKSGLDDRMNCFADKIGADHLSIHLDMDTAGHACRNMAVFQVPSGAPCMSPKVLWWDRRKDDYMFAVSAGANSTSCVVSWTSPSNAKFVGDHHVLISLAGALGGPRFSMVIGIEPGQIAQCGTVAEGYSVNDSSQLYMCR